MRQIKRSEFIQWSAGSLAALLLSRIGCTGPGLKTFGLQLYSVRDIFEKDPAGTIRLVAAMGYSELESYERNGDMFWGLGNKGFKKLADELGVSLISSHCDAEKDFERKAAMAAEIGMKFLVFNWPYAQQPMDEYKKKADLFNRSGEICKKAGMQFAWHNYASSYERVGGIFPQDLIMNQTDPSTVFHQMDIYWVYRAGQDPAEWIRKYPNRYLMSHIKDGNDKETTVLGRGKLDLKKIIEAGRAGGMKHFIVEQEHYQGMDSVEAAEKNAGWMKSA